MNRRDFLLSTSSLLLAPAALIAQEAPKPASSDIVFADFESGTYDGWTLTGNCWGTTPVSEATFPGIITGFQGKYYLGTYTAKLGTAAIGRATSKEFTIEKPFINFLIGGGYYPNEACVNLLIDRKAARTRSGNHTRTLTETTWDVSKLIGQKARIEVVDMSNAADRGYIMVDRIVFSDLPCAERQKNLEYARKQVDQNTHPPVSELDKLAAAQLLTFGKAIGIPASELTSIRVGNHGTFIITMTDKWLYRCDVAGNQTFRPISNLPQVASGSNTQVDPETSIVNTDKLAKETKELAATLGFNIGANLTSVVIKKRGNNSGR